MLPCRVFLLLFLAVVTYSADRLKPNKKKTFKGHLVAGAPRCQLQALMSWLHRTALVCRWLQMPQ